MQQLNRQGEVIDFFPYPESERLERGKQEQVESTMLGQPLEVSDLLP
jgi:hypothetical protein